MTASISTPRLRTYAAWALQILLAAAFWVRVSGVPMMVELFDPIGVGQRFHVVTGVVEVGGAVLLLVPGLAVAGAALLGTTMVFAVLTHVVVLQNSPAAALVLLALNLAVLALWRDEIVTLRRRLLGR